MLDTIVADVVAAEVAFKVVPNSGVNKRAFVLTILQSRMTPEQIEMYGPILGEVIDLVVELLKQPALLSNVRKWCFR